MLSFCDDFCERFNTTFIESLYFLLFNSVTPFSVALWYSLYNLIEGGRLSWPRHCSEYVQPMLSVWNCMSFGQIAVGREFQIFFSYNAEIEGTKWHEDKCSRLPFWPCLQIWRDILAIMHGYGNEWIFSWWHLCICYFVHMQGISNNRRPKLIELSIHAMTKQSCILVLCVIDSLRIECIWLIT